MLDLSAYVLSCCLCVGFVCLCVRFFLGLALSLRKDGAGDRSREAANCLFDGIEAYLKHQCENSLSADEQGYAVSVIQIYTLVTI